MNAGPSAADIHTIRSICASPKHSVRLLGADYPVDMKALDGLSLFKQWLALTDPCQAKRDRHGQQVVVVHARNLPS
jgi:hypothetical protein